MRTVRTAVLLGAALLLAAPGRAAPDFGVVTNVQVPEGQRLEDAALLDANGDGRPDLVIATHVWGRTFDRHLRVHLRQAGRVAYSPTPDRTLALTPDVVAWSVGDVDPAKGDEVVLFTTRGAYAWRTAAPERDLPAKLAAMDFLWQLSHPREAFRWADGVKDVDGDGLGDLLLPEDGGYRIFFQRRADGRATFERETFLELPPVEAPPGRESVAAAREKLEDLRRELSLGVEEAERGDFLAVWNALPYPVFDDFDADGRVDLLAETAAELFVWKQQAGGRFPDRPDGRRTLPLTVDAGRRLDFSFSARAADLDGDRRTDYVITAGDRRSENVRTQVLVYLHAKGEEGRLFGEKGLPQQALFLGGFAALLDVADVDGNGSPDLVMGSVKVDALSAIRAAAKGDLDADLYVYLNDKGRFSTQPDFAMRVPIPAKDVQRAGKTITARFLPGLAGGGTAALLLRDDPERLRLLAVQKTRQGLRAFPNPLFETRIDRRARLQIASTRGRPELLVLEDHQLLHVRFEP